jgi:hypothetical protein
MQMIEVKKRPLLTGYNLGSEEDRIIANLLCLVVKAWMEEIRTMVMVAARAGMRADELDNQEYSKWRMSMDSFRTRPWILVEASLPELIVLLIPHREQQREGLPGLLEKTGPANITAIEVATMLVMSGKAKGALPRDLPIVARSRVPGMMKLLLATKTMVTTTTENTIRVLAWCIGTYFGMTYMPRQAGGRLGAGVWRHIQSGGATSSLTDREAIIGVEPEVEGAEASLAGNRGRVWHLETTRYWPNAMWKIVDHTVPPAETEFNSGEGPYPFMDRCKRWAMAKYDPKVGVFPLAVFIAKMVSALAPNVYSRPDVLKLMVEEEAASEPQVREALLNSDWIEKKKKGGKSTEAVFSSWFIFVVCAMHPDSPLRRERLDVSKTMNNEAEDGGQSWTTRACELMTMSEA